MNVHVSPSGEVCTDSAEARGRYAEIIYRFVFGSIMRHRLFNGDPHPGNYLFSPDGKVVFLDFGCVKFFDEATARGMRELHQHHLAGDLVAFRRQLVAFGFIPDDAPVSTELYYEYMGFFYEPFRHDREFTFTREYTSSSLAHVFDQSDPRYGEIPKQSNMPRDFVFLNRLQWGLWPLLAELGARNDWHGIHREYIDGAEPRNALGLVFAALTFLVKGPVGFFAGLLSAWLRSRPGFLVWLYRSSGAILIGLGVRLAFERRE